MIDRKNLEHLGSRSFEHPADKTALGALRKVPGFDMVLRKFIGLVGERSLRTIYLAGAVKVTPKQFPALHEIYSECIEVLCLETTPELFVAQTPFVNAGAIGTDRPFIVLNSGAVDLFTEDEYRFILGHELGHIMADHVLYKTMLKLLLRMSVFRYGIPLSWVVLTAVILALNEWDRKSELTSDRAGLLCSQDINASYSALMKMAGGSHKDEMNIEEFTNQANEYRTGRDKLDSFYKVLNLVGQTHPFPVLRLAELQNWIQEGEYDKILSGDYPEKTEEETTSIYEQIKESAKAYKKTFDESEDPVMQFVKEMGKDVTGKSGQIFDSLKDIFNKKGF